MNSLFFDILPQHSTNWYISGWLFDFYFLGSLLLMGQCIAIWLIKQPVRRMAVAWATALGLVLLAVLCAVPDWSSVHLAAAPSTPYVDFHEVKEPAVQQFASPRMQDSVEFSTLHSPVDYQPSKPSIVNWENAALGILAFGSIGVLSWLILGFWQVRRICRNSSPAPSAIQSLVAELVPVGMTVPQLRIHPLVTVAVAVGLRRPCILLSESIVTGTVEQPKQRFQLRSVLAHELSHVWRRDLWLLAILRVQMILLWWHPLFWLCRRQVRLDQEFLADMAAAELAGRDQYAEQLLMLARSTAEQYVPRLASSVGLWETPSQLKRRISLLLNKQLTLLQSCSRGWRIGSLASLLGLAMALSLVTLTPAETEPVANKTTEQSQATSDSEEPSAIPNNGGPSVERVSPTDAKLSQLQKQLHASREPNTIIGMCVDTEGQPLPGVEVNAYSTSLDGSKGKPEKIRSTNTDKSGMFRFEDVVDVEKEFPEGLPEGDVPPLGKLTTISIVARSRGRVSSFRRGFVRSIANSGNVQLSVMPPAAKLTGQVVDEQGSAIEGARVSATALLGLEGAPEEILSDTTSVTGEFTIDDLPPYSVDDAREEFDKSNQESSTYAGSIQPWERFMSVTHPEFARKQLHITEIPGHIQVTLSPGATIEGRVFTQVANENAKPAAGVLIELQSHSQERIQLQRQMSNSEGNYVFESLPPGKYRIIPRASEWVGRGIKEIEVERGKMISASEIVMTRGGTVRIQLVDDTTGEPLKLGKSTMAKVYARRIPREKHISSIPSIVEFSPDGVGEVQVLPGKMSILVDLEYENYQSVEFAILRNAEDSNQMPSYKVEEGEVLEITSRMEQPKLSTMTGEMHFVPTTPPSEIDKSQDPPTPPVPPADTPEDLPSDPPNGHSREAIDRSGTQTELQDRRDESQEPNTLKGICVDEEGNAIEGAKVSFERESKLTEKVPNVRSNHHSTVTSASGEFTIDDLEAYDAEAARSAYEAEQRETFTVKIAGGDETWERFVRVTHPDFATKRVRLSKVPGHITVTLSPEASITGRVVFQKDKGEFAGAAEVLVTLKSLPPAKAPHGLPLYEELKTSTDFEGKYQFGSLAPGKYTVQVSTPDWVTLGIKEIEVQQGEAVTAPDIVMTRGGTVRIQLVDDSTGEPLTFKKATAGYVHLQPLPLEEFYYNRLQPIEYTPGGVAEVTAAAGSYVILTTIPATSDQKSYRSIEYLQMGRPDTWEKLPSYEVKEGEVLEIYAHVEQM